MFNRKNDSVPEWASALKKKDYPLFLQAIEDYFASRGESYEIGDGVVRIEGKDQQLGLTNLVQMCAQIGPKDYPTVVAGHFDSIFESWAFMEAFDKTVGDFEKTKGYIGVRLYDSDYVATLGEGIVSRPFAGSLVATLVYDFPQAIITVPRGDTEKWGQAENDLFSLGKENIHNAYNLEVEEVNMGDDAIYVVGSDHPFASNALLEIEEHGEWVGKGGAIVAAPTQQGTMIYPVRDLRVMNALQAFFRMVPDIYAACPGSLTPEVFWYHNGEYEPLSYTSGRKPSFFPSESFLAMLNEGLA